MWLLLLAMGGLWVVTAKRGTHSTEGVGPFRLPSTVSGGPKTSAQHGQARLPWWPPIATAPVKSKTRNTGVTRFPVDVYNWPVPSLNQVYVLAVASNDPTSFVAYSIVLTAGNKKKVLVARGPGPLTSQIAAQI